MITSRDSIQCIGPADLAFIRYDRSRQAYTHFFYYHHHAMLKNFRNMSLSSRDVLNLKKGYNKNGIYLYS